MSKEFEFFIYLLERYAAYKQQPTPEVLKVWNETLVRGTEPLTDFIQDMYFIYHQESLQNAFMDIDHMVETGEPLDW